MTKTSKQVHRVMWIKLSKDGVTTWVNTSQVRVITEQHKRCAIVFTSGHVMEVDQTIEEVMTALGYKMVRPPVEGYETEFEGSVILSEQSGEPETQEKA
jgi:hypothetical protein